MQAPEFPNQCAPLRRGCPNVKGGLPIIFPRKTTNTRRGSSLVVRRPGSAGVSLLSVLTYAAKYPSSLV